IIMDGSVYSGASYSAGEFGHMTLYPDGDPCLCGDNGCYEQYASRCSKALLEACCYEQYASSRALEQRVLDYFHESIPLPELFSRAKNGNQVADLIIDKWMDDVALGIKSLVHIFNPPLIVIGGGISEQGDYLLRKLQK